MSLRDLEQSHADLSKIPCLEPNRLVGFINHFAASLAQQLSNFNAAADQRLYRIHSRIMTCKTNLLILEKKLASVDGLSITPSANNVVIAPQVPQSGVSTAGEESVQVNGPDEEIENPGQGAVMLADEADGGDADPEADAELQRFHKMLKVGVPLPAVRMKMMSEGIDPDRLKI